MCASFGGARTNVLPAWCTTVPCLCVCEALAHSTTARVADTTLTYSALAKRARMQAHTSHCTSTVASLNTNTKNSPPNSFWPTHTHTHTHLLPHTPSCFATSSHTRNSHSDCPPLTTLLRLLDLSLLEHAHHQHCFFVLVRAPHITTSLPCLLCDIDVQIRFSRNISRVLE